MCCAKLSRRVVFALLLALGATASLNAAPITYHITIDTAASGLNGQTGTIEFIFSPAGVNSSAATATVFNVVGGGGFGPLQSDPFLGTPNPSGDVNPPTGFGTSVEFGNSTAFNSIAQFYNFGATIEFDVTFAGDALDTPNGFGEGSSFSVNLYDDTDTQVGFDPQTGSSLRIDINADTTTTVNGPVNGTAVVVSTGVPEPATLVLLGLGAAGYAARRPLRRRK